MVVFRQLNRCIVAGTIKTGVRKVARIYQTNNMGEADVRVAIVQRGNADLLVHRAASYGLAHGDAQWFITRERQDATASMYFTSQASRNWPSVLSTAPARRAGPNHTG